MKLNKKDIDMLWGKTGPYSEAKIIINTRILDDSVSRVMVEVEGNINPTTFKIIKKNRKKFLDDQMICEILDTAVYQDEKFGYLIAASYEEYDGPATMALAQTRVEYMKKAIIRMHHFVMDYLE
jgi:hypothetical protein